MTLGVYALTMWLNAHNPQLKYALASMTNLSLEHRMPSLCAPAADCRGYVALPRGIYCCRRRSCGHIMPLAGLERFFHHSPALRLFWSVPKRRALTEPGPYRYFALPRVWRGTPWWSVSVGGGTGVRMRNFSIRWHFELSLVSKWAGFRRPHYKPFQRGVFSITHLH